MDPSTFKCPKCDFTHASLNSLRIHWQKRHNGTALDLRLALFHDNKRPICECGCGEETSFDGLMLGFTRFINGHNTRVHNNWGHNPGVVKKSHDVQREMWKRGEMTKWRLGLSTDDPRNKALIEKMTATLRTDALRAQRSGHMKDLWKQGILEPLQGPNHSQWRGGTSVLQPLVRSHLHARWTYPKLKAAGFTCNNCGSKHDLCVHHDQERFAEILQKAILTLGEAGDDFERKVEIAEWVADYHTKNDVSGIVLCANCHVQAHSCDT